MKLFQKKYSIHTILVFVIFLIGCSNPESRKEAQKLIEKQAKVLNDVKKVEEDYHKIESLSDSLKNQQLRIEEKKNKVKKDLQRMDTLKDNVSSEIKEQKQNEFKEQIADLEKQLENVNRKLLQLEQKDSINSATKDTIYVKKKQEINKSEETKKQNNRTINDSTINDGEVNQKSVKNQEDLLKILEGEKEAQQKKENVSKQDSFLNNNEAKEETKSVDDNSEDIKVLKELDEEIIARKSEIDSFKKEAAHEAKKITQENEGAEKAASKSVSRTTKSITIIIAIGLVIFIVLFLIGKQGLAKKNMSQKK